MKTILHIINGLGQGGAEKNLYNLVSIKNRNFKHIIICLTDNKYYFNELKKKNIKVKFFNLKKNFFYSSIQLISILTYVRKIKPSLIQTWLPQSDLLGSLIGKITNIKVIWNIRTGKIDFKDLKFFTFIIIILCKLLKNFLSDYVVFNSLEAKKFYNLKKNYKFIPNLVNFKNFKLNKTIGKKTRYRLGIKKKQILIGQVARYHLLKNNIFLIHALHYLINIKKHKNIFCLFAGHGMDKTNIKILNLVKNYGLEKNIFLLGSIKNTNKIYNSLDLHIMTSISEGTPNAVLESYACKTLNIAPALPNFIKIIKNKNFIYQVNSIQDLAKKILYCLNLSKTKKNYFISENYTRILKRYDIKTVSKNYFKLWNKL